VLCCPSGGDHGREGLLCTGADGGIFGGKVVPNPFRRAFEHRQDHLGSRFIHERAMGYAEVRDKVPGLNFCLKAAPYGCAGDFRECRLQDQESR
jgi:hypothetical protein